MKPIRPGHEVDIGQAGTEPVVRRGRPTGDHAAKRAELLKAAASMIAQEGYANASLRKVAQRAGKTTEAVTYYFANKQKLVVALAEICFDAYDALLGASHDDTDLRGLLERRLELTTGDLEYGPVMSQLLAHARYEPAVTELIERRNSSCREVYTSILANGWMTMLPFPPERLAASRAPAFVDCAMVMIAPAPEQSARAGA